MSGWNPNVHPSTGRLFAFPTNIRLSVKSCRGKLYSSNSPVISDKVTKRFATVIPVVTAVAIMVVVFFFFFMIWLMPRPIFKKLFWHNSQQYWKISKQKLIWD
jgi:hypothetical protein